VCGADAIITDAIITDAIITDAAVQAPQNPVQSISSPRMAGMHGWTCLVQTHHSACVPLQMGRCEIFTQGSSPL
jgi:hypothetical protein